MTTYLTEEQIEQARLRPDDSLEALDAADAEDRLIDYVPFVWDTVEPARPFIKGWAIEAICDHLEAVHRREIMRLLINVPPGFMKSLATSVMFPSWEWGPRNKPSTRYVCASYSDSLTIRDNVKTRMVIQSPRYQKYWGDRFQFDGDQNAKQKFANNKTGFKLATSVHGVGTGERGDCVIVDDPHNVLEAESDAKRNTALQWFSEVMPTRVNDKKTAVFIVIMQRVHEQDVSGLILEKELGYTHLCIPMHYDPNHPLVDKRRQWSGWRGDPRMYPDELAFPERFSEADIAEMTKDMMAWGGMYAVAGQLEQRPEPRGGGMVKEDWFEIVESRPVGACFAKARGWDFAGTEDGSGAGSASVLMEEYIVNDQSELYITDVWWDRVSPGGLYDQIKLTLELDGFGIFQSLPQDPGQSGKYQVNDLLDLFAGHDFEFTLESGDKEVRFRPFAAQAEIRARVGRKVKLLKATWNRLFLDQVTKFPKGRLKDVPDGLSRAYGGIVSRGNGQISVGGSVILHRQGASN